MAPEVAGSIPVSHPGRFRFACRGLVGLVQRSVAQVVEHRSPKPGVAGSSPAGPVGELGAGSVKLVRWGWWTWALRLVTIAVGSDRLLLAPGSQLPADTALSSRGLGRGPLKAQTRVRIPLALSFGRVVGPIVYRLGRDPFKVQRGVRLPLGLWVVGAGMRSITAPLAQLAEQVTLNH